MAARLLRRSMSYYSNKTHKQRIDRYLEKMAQINASLGTDSSSKEVANATMRIVKLEEKIRDVDPDFYKEIAPDSAKYDIELNEIDSEP